MLRKLTPLIMMLLIIFALVMPGCGGSSSSNNSTPTPPPAPVAPGAPTLVPADQQITVSWTAVANATSYQVYCLEINDSSKSNLITAVADTKCVINGLIDGTTYYIWIKAENSVGTSDYSPDAHATPTAPLTKPNAPTTVILTPGSRQLSVTWSAVNGADSYEVWYATKNDSGTAQQFGGEITEPTCVITGLINGTTYYVWVKAKNSLGVSDFSRVATGIAGGVKNYLSVNVFDASTNQSLSNVTLTIQETGQNITLNSSYQDWFYHGLYTMYLSKPGYITKGLIFDFTADLSANVYLNPVSNNQSYENITGKLQTNGVNYTNLFNVCAGAQSTVNFISNILDPQGNFSTSSVCNNHVVLAAYTMSSDSIAQITYIKTSLSKGYPLSNQLLQLPASPVNYSGTKPGSDCLVVKVNNGYTLAQQNSTAANYSFGVAVLAGDSITLESSQTVSNANYFSCQNAGGSGGTFNIQYPSTVPNYSLSTSGNNYQLEFTPVNFAAYYEVYAIQISGGQGAVPFQTMVLSGTSVSIPKNLFNSSADTTLVYLRAVQLNNYSLNNILSGTQNFDNYSFTEQQSSLSLGSIGAMSLNRSLTTQAMANLKNIRTKYQLNKLFIK
jgi:hypothetical protein